MKCLSLLGKHQLEVSLKETLLMLTRFSNLLDINNLEITFGYVFGQVSHF